MRKPFLMAQAASQGESQWAAAAKGAMGHACRVLTCYTVGDIQAAACMLPLDGRNGVLRILCIIVLHCCVCPLCGVLLGNLCALRFYKVISVSSSLGNGRLAK